MGDLPQSVLDIISAAVELAVKETVAAVQPRGERSYFKIMEKLLYNYPAIKRIVADKEAYTKVELTEKSKSIVGMNYQATRQGKEALIESLERDRETEYDITASQFRELDRVVREFESRREFPVIRLYYFREHIDGSPQEEAATWEDVAEELNVEEKTARRWRNKLVNDMAVCLFGIDAAIQAGTA